MKIVPGQESILVLIVNGIQLAVSGVRIDRPANADGSHSSIPDVGLGLTKLTSVQLVDAATVATAVAAATAIWAANGDLK